MPTAVKRRLEVFCYVLADKSALALDGIGLASSAGRDAYMFVSHCMLNLARMV